MERTERFYKMIRMLRASPVVSAADFQHSLEVSRATFKRDLEYLRDRFQVPIDFDRDLGGYRLVFAPGGPTELPGLWFSETETHALVSMHELLRSLEPGLLSPFIAPMMERLTQLLAGEDHTVQEVQRRIRVLQHAARRHKLEHFEVVATAVLERRRLVIRHYNRQNDTETEREVSPQRLVYYRDNWFLDTWCHLRADIRTFAVDALRAAALLDKRAKSVPDRELDELLMDSYGIFSGRARAKAVLRFSAERARWVSLETWHPRQKSRFEPDGSWTVEIPYADDRELLMDILKHGGQVEVLQPPALRERVAREARAISERYRKG